jgi:hypothetical protein
MGSTMGKCTESQAEVCKKQYCLSLQRDDFFTGKYKTMFVILADVGKPPDGEKPKYILKSPYVYFVFRNGKANIKCITGEVQFGLKKDPLSKEE